MEVRRGCHTEDENRKIVGRGQMMKCPVYYGTNRTIKQRNTIMTSIHFRRVAGWHSGGYPEGSKTKGKEIKYMYIRVTWAITVKAYLYSGIRDE